MPIRSIPLDKEGGTQLMFTAVELGEVVREIGAVEFAKKEANEEWTAQLKALKKRMFALAAKLGDKPDDAARSSA